MSAYRLLGFDLQDSSMKELVGGAKARAHPTIDAAMEAMAEDGWDLVQIAAGFGNWIYVLFERATEAA